MPFNGQIRQVTTRNKVTINEINVLRNQTGMGSRSAKKYLEDKQTVLEQYFDGEWIPIETIEVINE